MKILLAALAMATGLVSAACAGSLDGKTVPADAKWLVHIDVDAFKQGEVSRTIDSLWRQVPLAVQRLKILSKTIGMDPTEDLHGITIYGGDYAQPEAVVIVRAEVQQQRLMEFLKTRPDFRTVPLPAKGSGSQAQRELVHWTEKKGKQDEHTVTACWHRPGVFVFGRNPDEVKKALEVLDGTSPGLADNQAMLAAETPPSTVVEVRAAGLADVQLPFKSPLVRKSRFLLVALGEREGEVEQEAAVGGLLQPLDQPSVDGVDPRAGHAAREARVAGDLLEAAHVRVALEREPAGHPEHGQEHHSEDGALVEDAPRWPGSEADLHQSASTTMATTVRPK